MDSPDTYLFLRTCQGGHPAAIREPVLGIQLARGQVAAPGPTHPLDTFSESMHPHARYVGTQLLTLLQSIVIIGPPPSVAYPFILDLEGYPGQIISLFVVLVCPGYSDAPVQELTFPSPPSSGSDTASPTRPAHSKVGPARLLYVARSALTPDVTVWWALAVLFLAAAIFRTLISPQLTTRPSLMCIHTILSARRPFLAPRERQG